MADLILRGTITEIGDVQQLNDTFRKLEFVVKTEGEYPKDVCFQVVGDKIDTFLKWNDVSVQVDVSFNLESRQYGDRWFTNATAWRVKAVETNPAPAKSKPATAAQTVQVGVEDPEKDTLPF